jgi:hypothetical protein
LFAAPPLAGAAADQLGVGSVFVIMAALSLIAGLWAAVAKGLR